jgi:hypothetical protein
MGKAFKVFLLVLATGGAAFAQSDPEVRQRDPRFTLDAQYQRDGTGAPVGVTFKVTNNTDEPLCIRPHIRQAELTRGGGVAQVIVLEPRQRNVRIASFFMGNARYGGSVAFTATADTDCLTSPESSSAAR